MSQPYPLDNNFTYHKPFGNQPGRYERIRSLGKDLASFITMGDGRGLLGCPESRERSLALTKLEEAVMWANAAIARNEKEAPDGEA